MEFRQLEYFCTISELKNFTRTAEVLHVSQPSVTKAIKSLENELGLKLINRNQKHVSLTEEGQVFLLHAQKIMQAAEFAKRDMLRFQKDTPGTISFGIPPMVEAYLFPDFFSKFREAFPEVQLDVQEFNGSDEVREKAELGELDFGIILEKPGKAEKNEICLLEDEMSVCLSQKHHLAKQSEITLAELKEEKFIMQQPYTYQYREVYTHCAQAGFVPEVLLCTSQLKTIKQLVISNMGISILPNFVTRMDKILTHRHLKPTMKVSVSLYWGRHKTMSALDEKFTSFMRKYIATAEFRENFCQK